MLQESLVPVSVGDDDADSTAILTLTDALFQSQSATSSAPEQFRLVATAQACETTHEEDSATFSRLSESNRWRISAVEFATIVVPLAQPITPDSMREVLR